jgi:hypothetical protein
MFDTEWLAANQFWLELHEKGLTYVRRVDSDLSYEVSYELFKAVEINKDVVTELTADELVSKIAALSN